MGGAVSAIEQEFQQNEIAKSAFDFQKSIDETDSGLETNFLFTKFLINSVKNIFLEKSKKEEGFQHIIFPAKPITQAIVNGKMVPLPVHLQAPPTFRFSLFDKNKGHVEERSKVG